MPEEAKRPTLNQYIHDLDKRTVVLETRLDHMSETLQTQNTQLNALDRKLDTVVEHIARQNGTLPRIEAHMEKLNEWTEKHEKEVTVQRTACAQKFEGIAKVTSTNSTRTKLTWALLSAMFIGLLSLAVKELFF